MEYRYVLTNNDLHSIEGSWCGVQLFEIPFCPVDRGALTLGNGGGPAVWWVEEQEQSRTHYYSSLPTLLKCKTKWYKLLFVFYQSSTWPLRYRDRKLPKHFCFGLLRAIKLMIGVCLSKQFFCDWFFSQKRHLANLHKSTAHHHDEEFSHPSGSHHSWISQAEDETQWVPHRARTRGWGAQLCSLRSLSCEKEGSKVCAL